MRLVEDINLVAVARRKVASGLPQFADLVNPTISGSVNFDHVDRIARPDLRAGFTNAAGFRRGLGTRSAVQRQCQNARHGRLSATPVPAENVPMGDPLLLDR